MGSGGSWQIHWWEVTQLYDIISFSYMNLFGSSLNQIITSLILWYLRFWKMAEENMKKATFVSEAYGKPCHESLTSKFQIAQVQQSGRCRIESQDSGIQTSVSCKKLPYQVKICCVPSPGMPRNIGPRSLTILSRRSPTRPPRTTTERILVLRKKIKNVQRMMKTKKIKKSK